MQLQVVKNENTLLLTHSANHKNPPYLLKKKGLP